MTNWEVITKADRGSGHRLVRMTLRIDKKVSKVENHEKQKLLNIINTQKLKGMKGIFEINLKTDLKKLRRR